MNKRVSARGTFGDCSTIVLAGIRPSEQLPLIGWRVPSAASSQAPSSGGALTQTHSTKKHGRRKVSSIEASLLQTVRIRIGVAEPPLPALTFISISIVDIFSM